MTKRSAIQFFTVVGFLLSSSLGYCDDPTADDYVAFFANEVGEWKWERHDGESGTTHIGMSPTKRFLTYYVTKGGKPYLNGVAGYDASAEGWKLTLFGVEDAGETLFNGIAVLDKETLGKLGKEKFEYTMNSKSVSADGELVEAAQKVIVHDVDTREYQTIGGDFFLKTTRIKASDHMSGLSNFVGTWAMEREAPENRPGVSEGDALSSTMENRWILDKSAINMTAVTSSKGKQISAFFGTVGWDPAERAIISYGFRAPGGHAYSKWVPVGDDWHLIGYDIDSSGVRTTRIIVISDVEADSFSVQAIKRVVNGQQEDDQEKATWVRVEK